MADKEKQEPSIITFEFVDGDSTLFNYARNNISPFQMIIVAKIMQSIAEQEILDWQKEMIHDAEEE